MPYLPESLIQRAQDGEAPVGFESGLAQMVLNESVSSLPNASDPLELFRLWKQVSRYEYDKKDELRALAIDAVKAAFQIKGDDFINFESSLQDLGGIDALGDEDEPASCFNEEEEALLYEVEKRRIINCMIQGGAIRAQRIIMESIAIPEKAREDYRALMEGSIKQLFEIDERMFDLHQMKPAGISEVDYTSLPAKINAEAMCLPVLIQEMAKGLLEATALWGLPGALDDESVPPLVHQYHVDLRKEVLARADKLEYEIWDQRLGMGLHTLEFALPFSLEQFRQFCICPAKELVERLSP